jgi:hypothetical protein
MKHDDLLHALVFDIGDELARQLKQVEAHLHKLQRVGACCSARWAWVAPMFTIFSCVVGCSL